MFTKHANEREIGIMTFPTDFLQPLHKPAMAYALPKSGSTESIEPRVLQKQPERSPKRLIINTQQSTDRSPSAGKRRSPIRQPQRISLPASFKERMLIRAIK